MKKSNIIVIFIVSMLLSGCASVVGGVNESVSVSTPPTKGATCKLSNSKGTWYVNSTPGSVSVHRAYSDLTVACEKQNYADAKLVVKSRTKPGVFGNVLIGGAIGAGVDIADGAAYGYPQSIVVPMHPTPKKYKFE